MLNARSRTSPLQAIEIPPRRMGLFQHLRIRLAIWRLEQRIQTCAESQRFHERNGHVFLAVAERDKQLMKRLKRELEQIATAYSNGIDAAASGHVGS